MFCCWLYGNEEVIVPSSLPPLSPPLPPSLFSSSSFFPFPPYLLLQPVSITSSFLQCTKALVWVRGTMSAALEVSVLVTLLTVSVIRTVVIEETAVVTLVSPALMVRGYGCAHMSTSAHACNMLVTCVHEFTLWWCMCVQCINVCVHTSVYAR